MIPNDRQPWNPDRRADPFIILLVLVILFLVGGHLRIARTVVPDPQVSFQGRIQDVLLGAANAPGPLPWLGWKPARRPIAGLAGGPRSGWDKAVLAVHAAEAGEIDTGATLIGEAPGPAGDAFRVAWRWCYLGTGSSPGPEALRAVRTALGDGYSARILEARLLAKSGGDPKPLEARAQAWAAARLLGFAAAGCAGLVLVLSGLAFALHLALTPARPVPLPRFGLSGRALLIVLLGWFLTLLAAGPTVGFLVRPFPQLKPVFLPMVYGFHALLGTAYLCRAEGLSLAALWRRVAPGRPGAALRSGLGFFALACAAVLAVSLALGPLLRDAPSPQKELLELLSNLRGSWAVTLLFLTVAVLAPAFEELMFRGFLLPWLGERLAARMDPSQGWFLAIVVTGLCFAAMHLQPLGLPTLTTLGIVLGYAFVRTGNLSSAILVHGLWNGGIFLLMRNL